MSVIDTIKQEIHIIKNDITNLLDIDGRRGMQADLDMNDNQILNLAIEDVHYIGDAGEPAFTNSWVNYGGGETNAGYYINPFGVVYLVGLIKSGVVGSSAFTLPSDYRPSEKKRFIVMSNAVAHYAYIGHDGTVVLAAGGSNVSWELGQMFFRAA